MPHVWNNSFFLLSTITLSTLVFLRILLNDVPYDSNVFIYDTSNSTLSQLIVPWRPTNVSTYVEHNFTRKSNFSSYEISPSPPNPPVSIGYCIVHAPGAANFIELQLQLLYRPENMFVIHLDNKTSEEEELSIRQMVQVYGPSVQVIKKISGERFKFSLVQIALLCLNTLYEAQPSLDYFINLSSDSLLLVNVDAVHNFLSENSPISFLSHKCTILLDRPKSDADGCHRGHFTRLHDYFQLKRCHISRRCKIILPPEYKTISVGWSWFALHRNFIDYMYTDRLSHFNYWINFFSNSSLFYIPDEAFFQTLANQPARPNVTVPIIRQSLMFNLFSSWHVCKHPQMKGVDRSHACWLTEYDLQDAINLPLYRDNTPYLFARKFWNVPCYWPLYSSMSGCKDRNSSSSFITSMSRY